MHKEAIRHLDNTNIYKCQYTKRGGEVLFSIKSAKIGQGRAFYRVTLRGNSSRGGEHSAHIIGNYGIFSPKSVCVRFVFAPVEKFHGT